METEIPADQPAETGEVFLRKLVEQRVRVTVKDGRQIVGLLHCVDSQGNIIISNGVEFRRVGIR